MTEEQTKRMFERNRNKLPVIKFESKEELQKWLDEQNKGVKEFLEELNRDSEKIFKKRY